MIILDDYLPGQRSTLKEAGKAAMKGPQYIPPAQIISINNPFRIETIKTYQPCVCATCGKTCTMCCKRCCSVYYCSKTCQSTDWENHRQDCQKRQTAWNDFLSSDRVDAHSSAVSPPLYDNKTLHSTSVTTTASSNTSTTASTTTSTTTTQVVKIKSTQKHHR